MIKGILTPDEVCVELIEAQLTQTELCYIVDISPSTFTRWRAGQTSIGLDTYVRIISTIMKAKAQVARRRRRLKQSVAKYRASLGAERAVSLVPLSAAGVSGDDV